MEKPYKNRQLNTEGAPTRQTFFFPKNNPPVSVEAESLEEAEKAIKDITKEVKDIKDK